MHRTCGSRRIPSTTRPVSARASVTSNEYGSRPRPSNTSTVHTCHIVVRGMDTKAHCTSIIRNSSWTSSEATRGHVKKLLILTAPQHHTAHHTTLQITAPDSITHFTSHNGQAQHSTKQHTKKHHATNLCTLPKDHSTEDYISQHTNKTRQITARHSTANYISPNRPIHSTAQYTAPPRTQHRPAHYRALHRTAQHRTAPFSTAKGTLGITTPSNVSLATSLMSSSPQGESSELILTTTALRP